MSSKFSVHTTEAGTCFAASELRLRATLRLKMWVSSMPGNFDAASTRATELPTVPKPSSAIFTGAAAADVIACDVRHARRLRAWGFALVAISVFDLTGLDLLAARQVLKADDCLVGQQTLRSEFCAGRAAASLRRRGTSRRSRRRRHRRHELP